MLKELQENNELTKLLVLQEEIKTLPFGDIWEHYCETEGVPSDENWYSEVEKYETEVLAKRV